MTRFGVRLTCYTLDTTVPIQRNMTHVWVYVLHSLLDNMVQRPRRMTHVLVHDLLALFWKNVTETAQNDIRFGVRITYSLLDEAVAVSRRMTSFGLRFTPLVGQSCTETTQDDARSDVRFTQSLLGNAAPMSRKSDTCFAVRFKHSLFDKGIPKPRGRTHVLMQYLRCRKDK